MVGGEGAVVTATLPDVAGKKEQGVGSAGRQAAAELVRLAKERGLLLTGPEGLLRQLNKVVLETALYEEMAEHLGDEKAGQPRATCGTGRGPRRCGPRVPVRSGSRFRGTGRAPSSRRS